MEGGKGRGGEGEDRGEGRCSAHSAPATVLCHTYVHLEVGGPEVTFSVLKDPELLMSAGTLCGSWLDWMG